MFFIASKLLWAVLRPSVLLLAAAAAFPLLPRRRAARALSLAALSALAAVLVTPVADWTLAPLEDRLPRPAAPPASVDGVVVLGGAVDTGLTEARGLPALNDAAERMTEAAALARRYPGARIVFTGGQGALLPGALTEADVARRLWTALGLPPGRVLYEDRSRDTAQNAAFAKRLADPRPGQTWLLVTSAMHMPRAVAVFRAQGWPVVPWPVGYKSAPLWGGWTLGDFPRRLAMLDGAVHEYLGLVAYRVLGRTDSLFPAPDPSSAAGPAVPPHAPESP